MSRFATYNQGLGTIVEQAWAFMNEGDIESAVESFEAAFNFLGWALPYAEVGDLVAHPDGGLAVAERRMDALHGPTIVLSGDGLPADFVWAAGVPDADSTDVYVERWVSENGTMTRRFHGYVDSVSRQIVQVG